MSTVVRNACHWLRVHVPSRARAGVSAIACLMLSVAHLLLATNASAQTRPTEWRIRVPAPSSSAAPVRATNARLLLAWWGWTEELTLDSKVDGTTLVFTVPLDLSALREKIPEIPSGANAHPDFGYVYLEFEDFAPVQSSRMTWTDTGVTVGLRGQETPEVAFGQQRDVTLNVRRSRTRQLRVVDDHDKPAIDTVVDGYMFWSYNNHCGVPTGLVPLFTGRRPNRDGFISVPDGDIDYGFELHGPGHTSIVEPRETAPASPMFATVSSDTPSLTVRIHRFERHPLVARVTTGGKPAAGVTVGAEYPSCSNDTRGIGKTDRDGMLRVEDFYPEEVMSVCVSSPERQPIDAVRPTLSGVVELSIPAGAQTGEHTFCYLP